MERILLLGKTGQLGSVLMNGLSVYGEVIPLSRMDLDLRDINKIRPVIKALKPTIVFNCIADTRVELIESEDRDACLVNAEAPRVIASALKEFGGSLVHFSTDYVFDGDTTVPYKETDNTNAINKYGLSKLAGEKYIVKSGIPYFIFRTSWVYGGKNSFITKIKNFNKSFPDLPTKVVADQYGTPNSTDDLARMVLEIFNTCKGDFYSFVHKFAGVYHLSASGVASWFDFADEIFTQHGINGMLAKIKSESLGSMVDRPKYSALCSDKAKETFGIEIKDWRKVHHDFIASQVRKHTL